ncbi:unnamed protein product [Protopolystoma xenopodis]|uniref:Uncharacterized protein n=1 Tax=Protopolystoma xenopodis TaxID=117903 RepID=A0A448WBB3_9PLAT|nr:unnamed protein product [Protopolystoma xenopodis]
MLSLSVCAIKQHRYASQNEEMSNFEEIEPEVDYETDLRLLKNRRSALDNEMLGMDQRWRRSSQQRRHQSPVVRHALKKRLSELEKRYLTMDKPTEYVNFD